MLQLEKTFVRNGFHYTQLYREEMVAMYQRVSIDFRTLEIESDPMVDFEVVQIQHQDADTIIVKDKSFDVVEKEVYPKGATWGRLGFSFHNRSEAKEHFDMMIKEQL